ncbi:hypothetical protein LTS18_002648 [Coniosporium uncinatum]|uniref:Uncharacterized protein n=1 Tax=Coniosporium uncinatum TaxID=93489 RepID=A0ACC3D7K9_9PEZI|nr:hypothetical protein LTS18_002648 [Coniosporium uncinatum]
MSSEQASLRPYDADLWAMLEAEQGFKMCVPSSAIDSAIAQQPKPVTYHWTKKPDSDCRQASGSGRCCVKLSTAITILHPELQLGHPTTHEIKYDNTNEPLSRQPDERFCEEEVAGQHAVWFSGEHFIRLRRCGELISSALALGLHENIQPSASIPFFLAELRKRAFASAYGDDKIASIFLGRPPRLSHRYCVIQAPLDLHEDELLSEGAELQSALNGLDADGWNKAGLVRRCGWVRVGLRSNIIREDILELSLGNHSKEETTVLAEAIISKLRKQYADLPPHYRPAYDTDWAAERNPLGALLIICSRMTYEMNQLLIQMVLIKKTGTDTGELIACARRMFKDVLQFATRRDITRDFQADHSWIMGTNGLRSASILAIELLKQEQLPGYLSSNPVPRSETIKDLSVFLACLASVDPNDGCWTVCNHGRKILDEILDKILTPAPVKPDAPVLGPGQMPALAPADSLSGMGVDLSAPYPFDNDADFVRWLENMEWEKGGSWTNLA